MTLKLKAKFIDYYERLGLEKKNDGTYEFIDKKAKYQCVLFGIYCATKAVIIIVGIALGINSAIEVGKNL